MLEAADEIINVESKQRLSIDALRSVPDLAVKVEPAIGLRVDTAASPARESVRTAGTR